MNWSNKISGWMRVTLKLLCVWAKEADLKCVRHACWFLCPDHAVNVSVETKLKGWVGKTATWQTEHELRNLSVMTLCLLWLVRLLGDPCLGEPVEPADCGCVFVVCVRSTSLSRLWDCPTHSFKTTIKELDGGKLRETQRCEEAIKSRNEGPPSDV